MLATQTQINKVYFRITPKAIKHANFYAVGRQLGCVLYKAQNLPRPWDTFLHTASKFLTLTVFHFV